MPTWDISLYSRWFYELTNSSDPQTGEQVTIGVTRMGELDEYTDRVMQDWTQRTDAAQVSHAHNGTATPQQKSLFFGHRFCTYAEYQNLFSAKSHEANTWKAILFTYFGMSDEQKQNIFIGHFTPDRDGYFKLMEMVNPQMRTFFFPALSYRHPPC